MIDFKELTKNYAKKIAYKNISIPENCLPCEMESYEKIKLAKVYNELAKDFMEIDLSFLSMRKNGLPVFGVININDSDCTFMATLVRNFDFVSPSKYINKYYKDILQMLGEQCIPLYNEYHSISCSLTSIFNGIIPAHTKQLIKDNKDRFDEVLLIYESDNWVLESKKIELPRNPDPLIVGIMKEKAYLISVFDVTTIEDYVIKEFTNGD